jgi:hypothetical protein
MSVALEIEALKNFPSGESKEFRAQIERARQLREQVGSGPNLPPDVGIDRSKELRPIQRPSILRTVRDQE